MSGNIGRNAEPPRWNVSDPAFLLTVLRIMVALGIVSVAIGILFAQRMFSGLLSGAILGILLYLATLQAGRVFLRSRKLFWVMFWLLGAQAVLWVGMIILIAVVKVDAAGFAIGVSVLPIAILLATLYWWIIIRKGNVNE